MQRRELLELSEKVVIEGASLRHIYESRLISEKQLRYLLSEHLKGKDIRRALRREITEREIDFERDPQLRDRIRSRVSNHDSGGGLSDLLAKAGAHPATDQSTSTPKKEQSQAKSSAKKMPSKQLAGDGALIGVIVLLVLVAGYLLLGR